MSVVQLSHEERLRAEIFSRVQYGELTLQKGAELAGLSYRQMLRVDSRYQELGAAGVSPAEL